MTRPAVTRIVALTARGEMAEACKRKPFANGTEGDQWQYRWCEVCTRDHDQHNGNDGPGPGCDLWLHVLMGAPSEDLPWPEPWLPEPDDGTFPITPRVVCLAFEPCTKDECIGDPGAEERAELVSEVRAYWRERATP